MKPMPAAFTFNCPTEIEDAANHYAEFQKAGAEVYIVDHRHPPRRTRHGHENVRTSGQDPVPLAGDHQLTNAFGVTSPKKAWSAWPPS